MSNENVEKRKIHVIGFISNQTITITLVGKSAFELVHLCKGLLLVPFAQMADFRTVFRPICINRVTSIRLVVRKKTKKITYSLFEDIHSC